MSSYEVFMPKIEGTAQNQTDLVVMPSILGGNLRDKADSSRVSDLGQRAQTLAETLQIPVLALQRLSPDDLRSRKHVLGLPKAYDPSEYTQIVAQEAAMISKVGEQLNRDKISLVGASAGAERGLAHVESGLPYRSLFLFDPTAMHKDSATRNFTRWATVQARTVIQDITGRADMPNEHPLPYRAEGQISGLDDMAIHRIIWTGAQSLRTIEKLAGLEIDGMEDSSTRLLVPAESFNFANGQVAGVVEMLSAIARGAKSDFTAELVQAPHRAADDPVRLVHMVTSSFIFPAI